MAFWVHSYMFSQQPCEGGAIVLPFLFSRGLRPKLTLFLVGRAACRKACAPDPNSAQDSLPVRPLGAPLGSLDNFLSTVWERTV